MESNFASNRGSLKPFLAEVHSFTVCFTDLFLENMQTTKRKENINVSYVEICCLSKCCRLIASTLPFETRQFLFNVHVSISEIKRRDFNSLSLNTVEYSSKDAVTQEIWKHNEVIQALMAYNELSMR